MKKFIIIFVCVCSLLPFPLFGQNNAATSIAMLNYLATEAQTIRASQNNRLTLENIYNSLINNTNPALIGETTQSYIESMLNYIEDFRVITVQRERLQFLKENAQAQAITQAMPNPLYLLSASSGGIPGLIAAAAMMTVDSVMSYQSAVNASNLEFLKDNWKLDDQAAAVFHGLRRDSWSYMVNITRENGLSGGDTLSEENLDSFVRNKFEQNPERKRQFLENYRSTYSKYGAYWLELADVYYTLERYEDCIAAVTQYETIRSPIFRKDYEYAKALVKAIVSASNVYGSGRSYTLRATPYLERLTANIGESHWELRYFAAQIYISLANINNRAGNLKKAYDLLVENIRYLSIKQEEILDAHYAPVNEQIPSGLTEEQEDETKKAIRQLKKARETELPPCYDPFWLHYATLEALNEDMNIPEEQRVRTWVVAGKAFEPLFTMMDFWENSPTDESYRSFFSFKDGFFAGNNSYYLDLPEELLFGVHSINMKLWSDYDTHNENAVMWKDDETKWEVTQRGYLGARFYDAKVTLTTSSSFRLEKSKVYHLDIQINNFNSGNYYYNLLHFAKPAGKNDWELLSIEGGYANE